MSCDERGIDELELCSEEEPQHSSFCSYLMYSRSVSTIK